MAPVLWNNSIACSSRWSISRKASRYPQHRKLKHSCLAVCSVEWKPGRESSFELCSAESRCDFQEGSLNGTSCPEAKLMERRSLCQLLWVGFKKNLKNSEDGASVYLHAVSNPWTLCSFKCNTSANSYSYELAIKMTLVKRATKNI